MTATQAGVSRLDSRHIGNHAREAVARRLGSPMPEAVRAVERHGTSVIVRLNSGGNALAVEQYLSERGYRTEDVGGNPDGYGCAVRVLLAS